MLGFCHMNTARDLRRPFSALTPTCQRTPGLCQHVGLSSVIPETNEQNVTNHRREGKKTGTKRATVF
jgi:hypothetical protein